MLTCYPKIIYFSLIAGSYIMLTSILYAESITLCYNLHFILMLYSIHSKIQHLKLVSRNTKGILAVLYAGIYTLGWILYIMLACYPKIIYFLLIARLYIMLISVLYVGSITLCYNFILLSKNPTSQTSIKEH